MIRVAGYGFMAGTVAYLCFCQQWAALGVGLLGVAFLAVAEVSEWRERRQGWYRR